MERFLVVVLAILAQMTEAVADPVTSFGLGAASCKSYLESPPQAPRVDPYVQWVSGYVVARAAMTTQELPAELNIDTLGLSVREYCASNPSSNMFSAAGHVASTFHVGR